MVSRTLCPAVHILVSQNVYGRAEGIADHYWPQADLFKILKFLSLILSRTADQRGRCPTEQRMEFPSVRPWGHGLFKGRLET